MIAEINQPKVNENAVAIIESILNRASTGDVQSIIALGFDGNGKCWSQFSIAGNTLTLLGELRLVERDIMDLFFDKRVP